MEFLGKFGIDFKLLIAQIINFLVLVFILKKILYQPFLKKIKEEKERIKNLREKEIVLEREKRKMLEKEKEIIEKTKQKTREILETIQMISEKERREILERAEKEVEEILKRAREKGLLELKEMKEKEKEIIKEKIRKILKEIFSFTFKKKLHEIYLEETFKELERLDYKTLREKEILMIEVIFASLPSRRFLRKLSNFFFSKFKNPVFKTKLDPEILAGMIVKFNQGVFLIDGSLKRKIEEVISHL